MNSAYSRLAPFIREYIYEKKWKQLRDIQEAAINEIFDGCGHILIAAGTASGKTEACFFPVISLFSKAPPASIGALYIGPLKALINDQASRLAPLLEQAEIPLWRWHGDVPNNHKKKLLKNPSGILQITPESLEALLMRNPQTLMPLFHDLSFVIIDEVHAFMGSERGNQILCQLARIEQAALCRPRRIGLSATLGDYHGAMKWLARGSGRGKRNSTEAQTEGQEAVLLREEKTKRSVSIAVDHFNDTGSGENDYYRALYRETRGRRCIIFTNSRIEAEKVTASLGKIAKECGGQDRFYIHHGSIAAGHRDETERELRESPLPITAAATATLEMGIDIGALDRVMQIGPPSSVSAFVQRLGRSGRLRKKPQIYFSSLEENRSWEHPVNALPWGLIKTIAIIELYIREKWIEPGTGNPLPYSLLLHQTLSVLCSLGGFRPAVLAKSILALPAFSHVSEGDYAKLLSHLASSSFIEKTDEGMLIASVEAEKLCSHYSFYSVFSGATEYRVLAGGREIGRINFIPPEGCNIVLGGRYWRVESSSYGRTAGEREIMVSPGEAGSRKVWRGSGVELHRKVAAYMRKIVSDNTDYPYLSASAKDRLACARKIAKQWELAEEIFIPAESPLPEYPFDAGVDVSDPDEKNSSLVLFSLLPWMGSRGLRTLLLILQNRDYQKALCIRSISRENDFSFSICSSLPILRFRAELSEIIKRHRHLESLYPLIEAEQLPMLGKFDPHLPPELLVKQYAAAMLDTGELKTLSD